MPDNDRYDLDLREIVEELPTALGWLETTDLPFKLYKNYLDELSPAFGSALAFIIQQDPKTGESLLHKVDNLPDGAFLRLLTAPTTCRLLRSYLEGQQDNLLPFFSDALEAEYCRLGKATDISHERWTVLGDWYFPRGQFVRADVFEEIPCLWKPDRVFHTPCLSNGIPIDFRSPFALDEKLPGISGPPSDFTSDELELLLWRFNEALAGISKVSTHTLDFITLVTKVVIVRKDLTRPNVFISSSIGDHLGRIVIMNPQLMSSALLAEALIHETIHSFLYMLELKRPFILTHSSATEPHICSPWTGADLGAYAYIHSCFVWFGLWRFWNLARGSGFFLEETIHERLIVSSSGFKKGSLVNALNQASLRVSPHLPQVLQVLQEAVMNSA